jgi:hypothetical protein
MLDYKDFKAQCVPARMECNKKDEYPKCEYKKKDCEEKQIVKCECKCEVEKPKRENKYFFCENVTLVSECGCKKKATVSGEIEFCEE